MKVKVFAGKELIIETVDFEDALYAIVGDINTGSFYENLRIVVEKEKNETI